MQQQTKEFFDTDFKDFSMYDNERSIPSLIDGLKPSQRKIIYALTTRGENAGEIKVGQLGPYAASVAAYHHGEGSISQAAIGLAQNFAGSNNMNLLEPIGQFGSRLSDEAAAARYIFTKFSDNFRKLIKKEDDIILHHLDDDGIKIEPETYFPILPLCLINGAKGIGTGFATDVLLYSPIQLRDYLLEQLINNKRPKKPLLPWYRGFKGEIYRDKEDGRIVIKGKLEVVNTTTIKITELPIGYSLFDYKEVLNRLEDDGWIKEYDDNSTEEKFEFIVSCPRSTTSLDEEDLYKRFKLVSRNSENLTLWVENKRLRNFESVEDIVDYFMKIRLQKYEERRVKMIEIHENDLDYNKERKRFIEFYINNSVLFSKKNRKECEELLEKNKFRFISDLLDIRIHQLTGEAIQKLEEKIKTIESAIVFLKKTNNKEMYIKELKEFSDAA